MPGEATNVGQVLSNPEQSATKTSLWERVTGKAKGVERQAGENQIAREFNKQEAEANRQFQERLSSSAYQRAMQDMRKAGLNPALMYGGAKPASAAGGSQASTSAGSTPTGDASGLFSTALTVAGALLTKGVSLGATAATAGTTAGATVASSATGAKAAINAAARARLVSQYTKSAQGLSPIQQAAQRQKALDLIKSRTR